MAVVERIFEPGTGGEAGWLRRTFFGPDPYHPDDAAWFRPMRMADVDLFEAWLIERFRAQLASEEYRATAEYHYLRAEWEREG